MAGPKRSRHARSKSCVVSFTLQAEVDGGAEAVLRDGMGSASPIAGVREERAREDVQGGDIFAHVRACVTLDEGTLPALLLIEEGEEQEKRRRVPRVSTAEEGERGGGGRFRLPGKTAWPHQQQLVTRWKNWVASVLRKAKEV